MAIIMRTMEELEAGGTETDAELVLAVLAGDGDAAAVLFRRHVEAIHAFALARVGGDTAAAEDIVQEAFLDAWRSLDRFDRSRCFPAWLVGIARRKLARHHRRAARSRSVSADPVIAFLEGPDPGPDDRLEAEEAARAVTRALAHLSAGARSLLLRKYRHGRSLREIGRELGIGPDAVSSRLQRARESFRKALAETGGRDAVER